MCVCVDSLIILSFQNILLSIHVWNALPLYFVGVGIERILIRMLELPYIYFIYILHISILYKCHIVYRIVFTFIHFCTMFGMYVRKTWVPNYPMYNGDDDVD